MSKLSVMFDCPDYGPDSGHYYSDEDTGHYTGVCSCGHIDPFAPRPDDHWPNCKCDPTNPDDQPPF